MDDGPGVDKAGKPGKWYKCHGCSKRIILPDSASEFKKRLTIAIAWIDDVLFYQDEDLLTEHEIDRYSVPVRTGKCDKCGQRAPTEPAMIGLHGRLAKDCKLAKSFAHALHEEAQENPSLRERAMAKNVAMHPRA